MKLAIFALVEHIEAHGKYYGYAPYVREMDLWNSYFDEVIVVAPKSGNKEIDSITIPYKHSNINFVEVPVFNIKSLPSILRLFVELPRMIFKMFQVMRKADHLHFRSPSNIAGIASIVQIFFANKKKSMRYTGNWDPESPQPIGYRFQKFVFSNIILTRNLTGLVYGKWLNQSKNINSFFTATFSENEIEKFQERDYSGQLVFMFLGALVKGKRPLLAIKIIEDLNKKGLNCRLDIYGDGPLRKELESYINQQKLSATILLHGNQNKSIIKEALKKSHFVILPSKSEGWPKAIAEGMFFGAIPISTRISCLEWMLDNGKRGVLIEPDVQQASETIYKEISKENLNEISEAAYCWSINYTVEKQAAEIEKIVTQ